MRKFLLLFLLMCCFNAFSQKRILSYTPSDLPIFINKSGDTLNKALAGGLNQPQFQALDINNDGKKDLIIHDRTGGVFLPFINVGNKDITSYKYSPNYVSSFPKISKGWVLFVDYDNDGLEDLWASIDFKVVLLKNVTKTGDKVVKFKQLSPYLKAYKYSGFPDPNLDSVNIASNFNNIPAIGDVDGDGDIDLFSYQSNEGNLLLYENKTKDFKLPLNPPVFDLADLCWGNFRDTAFDGVKVFACPFKYYRKKHSGGSNLLWIDNDNDGDQDLLMGNADGKNILFLKNGKKEFSLKRDSMISYNGHWPVNSTAVKLNSFPAAFLLDADGDGVNDIIVAPSQVERTSSIDQTEQVWFYKNMGSNSFPDFKFSMKNYFTNEFLDHGDFTSPNLKDIDNDGDYDLIISTNGDYAKTKDLAFRLVLYRNIGTKTKPVFKLEDEDLWKLSQDSIYNLSITFGDLNGDGLQDMIAGDYSGNLFYYKNIGTSTTWAFTTSTQNYDEINVGLNATPQLVDLDKDGKLDLVIGERDGNFNFYRNTGTSSFAKFTLVDDTLGNFISNEFVYDFNPPDYYYIGNAAGELADLDGDNKLDMVFGGEEGKVRVMKFDAFNQLKFLEDTLTMFDSAYMRYGTRDYGNRTRPTVADLNGDGVNDIIVGNDRGGIGFLLGNVKIVGVTEIHKLNEPAVFPNPANGNSIKILTKLTEKYEFVLMDLSGQIIRTEVSEAGNSTHNFIIDSISNGIYILKSDAASGHSYFNRIIIQR